MGVRHLGHSAEAAGPHPALTSCWRVSPPYKRPHSRMHWRDPLSRFQVSATSASPYHVMSGGCPRGARTRAYCSSYAAGSVCPLGPRAPTQLPGQSLHSQADAAVRFHLLGHLRPHLRAWYSRSAQGSALCGSQQAIHPWYCLRVPQERGACRSAWRLSCSSWRLCRRRLSTSQCLCTHVVSSAGTGIRRAPREPGGEAGDHAAYIPWSIARPWPCRWPCHAPGVAHALTWPRPGLRPWALPQMADFLVGGRQADFRDPAPVCSAGAPHTGTSCGRGASASAASHSRSSR